MGRKGVCQTKAKPRSPAPQRIARQVCQTKAKPRSPAPQRIRRQVCQTKENPRSPAPQRIRRQVCQTKEKPRSPATQTSRRAKAQNGHRPLPKRVGKRRSRRPRRRHIILDKRVHAVCTHVPRLSTWLQTRTVADVHKSLYKMNNIGLRLPTAAELKQKQRWQHLLRHVVLHQNPCHPPTLDVLRSYTIHDPNYMGSAIQVLPNHNGYYVLHMKQQQWFVDVAKAHYIQAPTSWLRTLFSRAHVHMHVTICVYFYSCNADL